MHKINIRALDLNLLVALKALLEEKHVTRAAERISLSQSAMSHALGRLRKMLNDPLLVKGSGGLTLTTRASELYPPLQSIFNDINQIISPPTANPASMQGDIIIATRDNEMVTILPQVINRIAHDAPGLTLRVIPLIGDDLSLLERQEADFIISGTEIKTGTLHRKTLYKEEFVCLVAAKNPVIKQGLTLENFLAMKHCLVTISGFGLGIVDALLARQGLTREISMRIPHFLAAAYIVADSELIVTVPRKIGLLLSQQQKVVMLEPPIKIPRFSIYLYWHARNQTNPLHTWLRKLFGTLEEKH